MPAKGGGRTNRLLYRYSLTDRSAAYGGFHGGKNAASSKLSRLAGTSPHEK